MRKRLAALLAVLLTASLCLAACGTEEDGGGGEEELVLTAALPDGEREDFLRRHLYENLMRWVDDGDGFAVLAPGQAESCTVETDYTGLATYTFTLRANAVWSDGQAVTAGQFARLAAAGGPGQRPAGGCADGADRRLGPGPGDRGHGPFGGVRPG